jgi:hypothetical protein
MPLFKLIIKSLIQEIKNHNNYREATNIIKTSQPNFFRIKDAKLSETQIMHYLIVKSQPIINILFGKNKDKIESFVPTIANMLTEIPNITVASELKTVKQNN